MKTLWKSLPKDMAPHRFEYRIGQWALYRGKVELCKSGFHASENVIDAMGYVPAEVIAKVQVRGESDIQNDKQAWSEMKIVKAWKWEKEDSVSLAIYAAELVIDIYEKEYPDDKRPRKAIEAAKKWTKNPTAYAAHSAYAADAADAADAAYAAHAASDAARDEIKAKCHAFVLARLKTKKPLK